jgi:4-carboxymuconolactone decarboxylase
MRLPLLLPTDLTAEQRPLYVSFEKMVQAREYSGFEVRNPEGAYIGPWGVFLQFPELSKPLIDFINLAQKLPGLSERARQVVILAIGGRSTSLTSFMPTIRWR